MHARRRLGSLSLTVLFRFVSLPRRLQLQVSPRWTNDEWLLSLMAVAISGE